MLLCGLPCPARDNLAFFVPAIPTFDHGAESNTFRTSGLTVHPMDTPTSGWGSQATLFGESPQSTLTPVLRVIRVGAYTCVVRPCQGTERHATRIPTSRCSGLRHAQLNVGDKSFPSVEVPGALLVLRRARKVNITRSFRSGIRKIRTTRPSASQWA